MAEAVWRHLVAQIPAPVPVEVDSAGTDSYHEGEPPDPRTLQTLRRHGMARDYAHAARRVTAADVREFDYLLCMDRYNATTLRRKRSAWRPKGAPVADDGRADDAIGLFSAFDGQAEEVGDPYYGGGDGFELAFEQCVRFSQGWIRRLLRWDVRVEPDGSVTATKVDE